MQAAHDHNQTALEGRYVSHLLPILGLITMVILPAVIFGRHAEVRRLILASASDTDFGSPNFAGGLCADFAKMAALGCHGVMPRRYPRKLRTYLQQRADNNQSVQQ
jgi:hypothetical protein